MREQPSATELLGAVRDFLRNEVMPALNGRLAFHTRVAANVLDIVERELEQGPSATTREAQRLATLLGCSGDVDVLNAALCDAIDTGAIARTDPALIAHLWSTAFDTVSIDQPSYQTFRRACAISEQLNKQTSGEM